MDVVHVDKNFVTIPSPLAWLAAVVLEQVQEVPLLSRDQIRSARMDGNCEPNHLVTELGLPATPLMDALQVYGGES